MKHFLVVIHAHQDVTGFNFTPMYRGTACGQVAERWMLIQLNGSCYSSHPDEII